MIKLIGYKKIRGVIMSELVLLIPYTFFVATIIFIVGYPIYQGLKDEK
jgi:hypothetical protein